MNLVNFISEYLNNNKKEIVNNLSSLVKIPSIAVLDSKDSKYPYGENCAKALDFCKELCLSKGLLVEEYEYRGIEVRLNNNNAVGKKIVFATHCDVVDVDNTNSFPHFNGEIVDNYVVGRGSVDDKGPLIATIYALAFFNTYNIPLNNDIRLFIGSNEESGMDDITYYLEKAGQPDLGLAADDDFPVVNGEKGLIRFVIKLKKPSDIYLIDSFGKNQRLRHDTCKVMCKNKEIIINSTDPLVNPVKEALKNISCKFSEDAYTNTFIREIILSDKAKIYKAKTKDDSIELYFDKRVPVTQNLEKSCEEITKLCSSKNLKLRFEIIKKSEGFYIPVSNNIVKQLTDLYNSTTNSNESPYVMSACTYARAFNFGLGFGMGNPHEIKPFPEGHGACHGDDEAQNIDVLLNGIRIYITAMNKIL